MPLQIKKLKAALVRAGFAQRSGKESHTVWTHPDTPALSLIISGKDGDDAQLYQVKRGKKCPGDDGKNALKMRGLVLPLIGFVQARRCWTTHSFEERAFPHPQKALQKRGTSGSDTVKEDQEKPVFDE